MTDYIITFSDGWIDSYGFERSLARLAVPLFTGQDNVTFHFCTSCKIMMDAAARLLSLANQIASKGITIHMIFEGEKSDVMNYLNRANFFNLLSKDVVVSPPLTSLRNVQSFHGTNNGLVELDAVGPAESDTNPELISRLQKAVGGQFKDFQNRSTLENAVYTIFSELINNIHVHSQTKLPGCAALQVYPNGKKVQIVVSDSGVGLLKTLKPKLSKQDLESIADSELIRLLFRNELEWNNEGNGQGLQNCVGKALKYSGQVDIRLATCSVTLRSTQGRYEIDSNAVYQLNLFHMEGTHICFTFEIA
jgi:anti-sigma regulatory factor (Ser/Thr protein kinase)